jgi:hypothetical protein
MLKQHALLRRIPKSFSLFGTHIGIRPTVKGIRRIGTMIDTPSLPSINGGHGTIKLINQAIHLETPTPRTVGMVLNLLDSMSRRNHKLTLQLSHLISWLAKEHYPACRPHHVTVVGVKSSDLNARLVSRQYPMVKVGSSLATSLRRESRFHRDGDQKKPRHKHKPRCTVHGAFYPAL